MSKEVGAGGRFDIFLDSAYCIGKSENPFSGREALYRDKYTCGIN